MNRSKILDCITFFDNNFMFEIRYNILKDVVDYFVICDGGSNTQVNAIANSITKNVSKKLKSKPWGVEGTENAEWILIDYVDVIVHVFQKTKRGLDDYKQFPESIKSFIDHLNSETFVKILENKFKIPNLMPDPTLFGGGMHESRKGGYLKLHSDFIYIRKRI